ncbi:MAG: indolepyruvate oxidoreductase subunit beta [Kiritimatiellia bacterium]|jgi:indolepyruvate ferredoxin oxidoreductase beta subunit
MDTVSIVLVGIGGQGTVTASDILANAAFRAGRDVKKAEVHGMSQRGGSVRTDVRFGSTVLSPITPAASADVVLSMDASQDAAAGPLLRPGGTLLTPAVLEGVSLPSPKTAAVAMLGALSRRLDLPEETWTDAIAAILPAKLLAMNLEAFALGRDAGRPCDPE